MINKTTVVLIIVSVIILGVYLINFTFKEDAQEIEEIVHSLNHPMIQVAHIEYLDKDKAIVFFERGPTDDRFFVTGVFRKGFWGWEHLGGQASPINMDHKLDLSFSGFSTNFSGYPEVVSGKIIDSEIDEVRVVTRAGNESEATIIEYDKNEKCWFLIGSNEEELLELTVTGLSSDGEVIERVTR
ncbi:hypothetical protein [Bacillus suaedae]|uniref:Uncharacterized protein n=1 Tax=Halalkalibacter suaedae TaxID=2822140 RepID=A0A940WU17_9BACI|nr:hypothetical protein [Bacillus suaedae]MBP3950223.1 hypothetical protein [Bacillus suaedae]